VHPPGAPEWERSAAGWLFDRCPGEYRAYGVLRRYPVVLARFVAHHVAACLDGNRRALAAARTELRDVVTPEVLAAAIQAYEREGARLVAETRAVGLVEEALRGRRYVPRL
jgi:hypothetical protein